MPPTPPPSEVAPLPRRRFTHAEKLRLLAILDTLPPEEMGGFLRKEGIYGSYLTAWRAARDRGDLDKPDKRRGPRPTPQDPRDARIQELERENLQLSLRAQKAEILLEAQKKVALLLEHAWPPPPATP